MKRIPPISLLLIVILVTGLLRFPRLWRDFVREDVLRTWNDPDEQLRQLYGPNIPYAAMRQAERNLAPTASILWVTTADDVKYTGYVTYHRLLYYLAPRPVVWVSAAAPDGSWESRQWISAELSPETVGEIAAAHHATCLLALSTPAQLLPGTEVARWDALAVYQLDPSHPCLAPVPNNRPFWAGNGWTLRLAAALLVIFLLGDALLVGVKRWGYAAAPLEWLILAWFGGSVSLSLLLFWTGSLGLSLGQQQLIFGGMAVFWGLIRLSLFLRRPDRFPKTCQVWVSQLLSQNPRHPINWLVAATLALVIIANLVFVALLVMGRPFFVWDSWIGWSIKARILFLEGGITPALYAEPARAITMQSYPLFLPLIYAWVYQWLGAPDDRLIGVVIWLFYLALVGTVYWGMVAPSNPKRALLAAATVASLGYVVLLFGSAFADGVLVVAAALTAVYWRNWLEPSSGTTPKPGSWILAAFCAGTLPWIKQDGLLLLATFLIVLLLRWLLQSKTQHAIRITHHASRPTLTLLLSTLLTTTLIAAPWYLFARGRAPSVTVFLPLNLTTFLANLDRLPVIAQYQIANLLNPLWQFFWLFMLLAPGYRLVRRQKVSFLWGVVLLYGNLTSLIFVFSDYPPFSQHILTSAYRLLAHLVVLPLLAEHKAD